jgi:hypothetical protein
VDLSRPTTDGPGDIDWPTLAKDPRFTESREDLKQLYELAQYGQLNDAFMRGLGQDQVTFLAAHHPAVASFEPEVETTRGKLDAMPKGGPSSQDYVREMMKLNDLAAQKNKLEQNARRARLDRTGGGTMRPAWRTGRTYASRRSSAWPVASSGQSSGNHRPVVRARLLMASG